MFVGLQDPRRTGRSGRSAARPGTGSARSATVNASSGAMNVGPGEQRHDHAGRQDEHGGDRAEDDQDDPEQRRGQPERLALAALLQQVCEHRHERRRQRRVGEQVADQVRDLKRDRERRGRARPSRRSSRRRLRARVPPRAIYRSRSRRSRCCGRPVPGRRPTSSPAAPTLLGLRRPRPPYSSPKLASGMPMISPARIDRTLLGARRGWRGHPSGAATGLLGPPPAPGSSCGDGSPTGSPSGGISDKAAIVRRSNDGQHSFSKEAHPAHRARAAGESPVHLGDQDLLPPPRGDDAERRHRPPPTPSTAS